ncbi:MAG: hypothetical protein QNJ14_00985 [Woeseiaceae bacterium]|nr:hypothetical protein [Woeseiaceae bacterium]
MNDTCQKCRRPIDTDIDSYTLFCDACLNSARRESDVRNARIDAGDINVRDLTLEEKQRVRTARREQLAQLSSHPQDIRQ